MEWQKMLETLSCKLRSTCCMKENFKREDELMTCLWADEGAMKLISLWLNQHHSKREIKSHAKAKVFKTVGNKQFQVKNYSQSIESYTKSAMYALSDSCDFSVAIANRSAALFYLGRYNDCIKDIELAIMLEYPEKLRYKLYLRKSQCYLKLGKQDLAKDAILKARETIDNCEDITTMAKDDIEKKISQLTLGSPCLENNTENTTADVSSQLRPQVVHGENPNFLCASAGIDIKESKETGRYVVANRFIKKGDILFVEKPVSFVLLNHNTINDLCSHCCCSYTDVPIPCKTCVDTLYCDMKCLNEGWYSYHRWECPGSQMGLWKEIGIAHLALKVLLTCTTTTDKIKFNKVQELVTNFEKLSSGDLIVYGVTAALLTTYLSEYTNFFDINDLRESLVTKFYDETLNFGCDLSTDKGKRLFISSLLLRYILQLVSNGHAIAKLNTTFSKKEDASSEEEDIVATGIYPSASMMNHSCDPNIINIFMDQYLIVRAAKDIAVGEEVFNCYGPHYRHMSREQRQKILKSQYCFTCKCDACTLPKFQYFLERFNALKCSNCDGALHNNNRNIFRCLDCGIEFVTIHDLGKIQRADQLFDAVKFAMKAGKQQEALIKLKKCLHTRQSMLYKYHEDITATFDYIAEIYAAMGRWAESVFYQEHNIAAVTERFGASSRELAYELHKLTDFCVRSLQEESNKSTKSYKDMVKKTQRYLDWAEEIMTFNYGHWNNACEEIRRKREECISYFPKHSNT